MAEVRFPPYFEAVAKSKARYIGLKGGRGSAKSHSFAGFGAIRMASEPDLRWVCIREVQRSIADSVKQLIDDKIEAYGLSPAFRSIETEVSHLNGARCIFRGMQNHTAASIKSLEGIDLAWVEEAQTLSKKSLELLTPTIRKPGSQLWFSWNPENEDDPVDVFFEENKDDPNFLCLHVNWDDNPFFPDELRQDMARDKARDPDKFAHVWEGQYRALSEARVFRNWKEGTIEPPHNVVWFYGVDWGFANDETAGLRCCIVGNVLYVDSEVYELGVPTEALPALIGRLPDARKWPIRADSARPETIDYVRRHGFSRMRGATKGKGSVEDGVTFLQGFDVVINPRCVNTIREFQRYAYKTDKQTGEILPAIEDANNHLIDALRYAVEGLHRKGKRISDDDARKPADPYDDEQELEDWTTI